ncbi:NB-ARC domain-containing protein [Streptomyces sp. SAS_270]|uniref:NB-ARC domain-containing protein n=1 Tax=Streptomyces sp. SAS_270 TaxID=3412748 RepID=UPI00403C8BCF
MSAEAAGERSVAAGGDIGSVSTGDFVTQIAQATVLPAEAFGTGPCTTKVLHLPDRTAQFVGRERELRLLGEAFGEAGGVVVHAVHGLGGIGKSTLAARWAADRTADFNPIWWITAESPAELDAGLAALGRALRPALVGVLTEEAFRECAIQWLSSNDGWLLVLDNVSDPSHIKPLLARAPDGRFLITTRRGAASWRGTATPLDLDVLQPAEAVELFGRIYDGPVDGVEELCAELGCLPLAVDQAAAYCREAGVTPRTYLELLARHPYDMYALTAEGGDAQRTVARVWQVTLDRLADTPMAAGILRVIAWWSPDGIPRAYLERLAGSPLELTEAIRRLAAYSMITLHGSATISVHRLVQAVVRTLIPRLTDTMREVSALVLHASLPGGLWGEATLEWATHVETLASHTALDSETEELTRLFLEAALRLARTYPERGTALCERAAAFVGRNPGTDVELVLDALQTAAMIHMAQGDAIRARRVLEEQIALADREFGEDHLYAFQARGALISVLMGRDRAAGESLASETLERAMRVLGPENMLTLHFRVQLNDLATEMVDLPAMEARLAEAERATGVGSPFSAGFRYRYLDALTEAGEYERAVVQAEKLVDWYGAEMGTMDRVTMQLRSQHVLLLVRVGEPERAAELLPDLISECIGAMGDTPEGRVLIGDLTALLAAISV